MTDDTSKMQTVTRALSQAVGSRKPNGIWCWSARSLTAGRVPAVDPLPVTIQDVLRW